jgi:hypothetical protein
VISCSEGDIGPPYCTSTVLEEPYQSRRPFAANGSRPQIGPKTLPGALRFFKRPFRFLMVRAGNGGAPRSSSIRRIDGGNAESGMPSVRPPSKPAYCRLIRHSR